jgi:hypothetical protein
MRGRGCCSVALHLCLRAGSLMPCTEMLLQSGGGFIFGGGTNFPGLKNSAGRACESTRARPLLPIESVMGVILCEAALPPLPEMCPPPKSSPTCDSRCISSPVPPLNVLQGSKMDVHPFPCRGEAL